MRIFSKFVVSCFKSTKKNSYEPRNCNKKSNPNILFYNIYHNLFYYSYTDKGDLHPDFSFCGYIGGGKSANLTTSSPQIFQ